MEDKVREYGERIFEIRRTVSRRNCRAKTYPLKPIPKYLIHIQL